ERRRGFGEERGALLGERRVGLAALRVLAVAPLLLVELRGGERGRRRLAERARRGNLRGVEAVRHPVIEVERAARLAGDDQRDRRHRSDPFALVLAAPLREQR